MMRRLLPLILLFAATFGHAQGVVEAIQKRGELVIATDATYKPFETKTKDGSGIEGFDVDLGAELAKALGVKVRWINQEWSGVLGSLESGKADLVMAGVTITDERKSKGYLYSRPYFLSGQAIARRKGDASILKPQDLVGKTVAVQAETTGQFAVQKLGVPKDRQLRFDGIEEGLQDVANRKSDACVGDEPTIKAYLPNYPNLELVGPAFVKENLGIVAWKGHEELVKKVNEALTAMLADGRYARFYGKWIGEPFTPALAKELDAQKGQGSPLDGTAPSASGATPGFTFRLDVLREALPRLLQGAILTLELTALSLVLGVAGGLGLALLRLSPLKAIRPPAVFYVEVVRGTPLLMQIYVIYFVLPAFGLNLPAFAAGVLALSLNAAAYTSEIFRAGIESIDPGQTEAARSLGMTHRMAMRWVVLPQTIRRVLPPLTNEAVALLKDSSLVSVVALEELMRQGKELATDGGSPTTIYLSVALIYLAMTLPLTYLVRRLEIRWGTGRRRVLQTQEGAA